MTIRKSRSSLTTLAKRPLHLQHGLIFLAAQSIVKMLGSITPKRRSKKFLELNSCNFIVWLHSMICFIKALSILSDYKHYPLKKTYIYQQTMKTEIDQTCDLTNIFNICVSEKIKILISFSLNNSTHCTMLILF